MREYPSAAAFAEDTKVPLAKLQETFESLQTYAAGTVKDPFGKSTCSSILEGTRSDHQPANFTNSVYSPDEPLLVAEMTPVVHYVRCFPVS